MPSKDDISNLRYESERIVSGLPKFALHTNMSKANILHGSNAQKKSGSGEDFWQFRNYQETDSPHNIDWRQSAKTDHVYIRQLEQQSINRSFLWCANGQSMNFSSSTKLKNKQVNAHLLTLSLSLLSIKSDDHIGLYGDMKTGRSERTLDKIADGISRNKSDETLPDITQFILPSYAGFIGIGDFLDPIDSINNRFEFLAERAGSGLIIQLLDPSELDLSTLSGRIHFKGLAANEDMVVNNVQSISDAYNKRINNHIQQIKNICKNIGWHYVLHVTDQPIEKTLHNICMLNSERGGV